MFSTLLKNGHLLRFPHASSLQRTVKYASLLRISGALHLALFEQPGKYDFLSRLLGLGWSQSEAVSPHLSADFHDTLWSQQHDADQDSALDEHADPSIPGQ